MRGWIPMTIPHSFHTKPADCLAVPWIPSPFNFAICPFVQGVEIPSHLLVHAQRNA
jgi:hypothetical protein